MNESQKASIEQSLAHMRHAWILFRANAGAAAVAQELNLDLNLALRWKNAFDHGVVIGDGCDLS